MHIVADALIQSPNSVIEASSQLGIDGAAFDEYDTCIVMDDNYELVSR